MSKIWRVGLRGTGVLAGMVWLVGAVWGSGFAAEGTKGTLELTVVVEGAGRHDNQGGGGWDSIEWEVKNRADLRVEAEAAMPEVDATAFAGMGAGDSDEEGDEDWEAAWDDKIDACDGDEICEQRVEMQKMQDPRFQAMMAGAMGALGDMDDIEEALSPSIQRWYMLAGAVTGTASVDEARHTMGAVAEDGSGKRNVHCRTTGEGTLTPQPSGYGDIHPVLAVNVKTSTYEIVLPVMDAVADIVSDCDPNRAVTRRTMLTSGPLEGDSWDWTVRGELSGSSDQPELTGTKTWTGTGLFDGGSPMRVTIKWKFGA